MFDTREEREELLHELVHLPNGTTAPNTFWIGLKRATPAGPASSWAWQDGLLLGSPGNSRPVPWGLGAPETPGGTQAYVVQTMGTPTVDTELVHSAIPPMGMAMPAVCQVF